MANKSYFNYIPDFDYVSRLPKAQSISDYLRVKNLFKRTKIADTIFNDLTYFTKYQIIGDERPDNIAYKIYGDSNLDWMVMLANNITNLQNEWPLEPNAFYKFLISKYGSEEKLQGVHHYITEEVKSSTGKLIVPKGLEVNEDFSVTYYDPGFGGERVATSITGPVTNQEYEEKIYDDKRNINVIKPKFIGLILEEMKRVMKYKPGSTQFVSKEVVRGENIRIYE
tara:strand:+ start:730 stop:1404 length:675 start_codon:yes stop_codon:yes gene_type:complete